MGIIGKVFEDTHAGIGAGFLVDILLPGFFGEDFEDDLGGGSPLGSTQLLV